MYQFTARPEVKDDCECRNRCKRNPSGLYAGIYNKDGYGVADIDRLGRVSRGEVTYLHEQIECNDEPDLHATTDEEWQSIPDCIAAAPEMLSLLKTIRDDLGCGEALSAAEADAMRNSIDAVLAKAEPPRMERHRVSVTVEVEIETTHGEASKPGNVCMAAVEAVRDGEGTIVAHEIVGQC
jgi:hypothetical protein